MNKGLWAAILLWAVAPGLRAAEHGAAQAAATQSNWFTVMGDASQAGADTVQVDPLALKPEGDAKTMPVRVSRSQERRNWDDVPYRSYESRVRIDCRTHKAHYLEATFYMEPLWRGRPHQVASYAQKPPAMLFRGISPNPTERIIRAACRPTG